MVSSEEVRRTRGCRGRQLFSTATAQGTLAGRKKKRRESAFHSQAAAPVVPVNQPTATAKTSGKELAPRAWRSPHACEIRVLLILMCPLSSSPPMTAAALPCQGHAAAQPQHGQLCCSEQQQERHGAAWASEGWRRTARSCLLLQAPLLLITTRSLL